MKTNKTIIFFTLFALAILVQPFTANAVVEWTKDYTNSPVLEKGGAGTWDEEHVDRPMVIKDGSTYKMWYLGLNSSGVTKGQIGYATSNDGITNWQKHESGVSPVFSPTSGTTGWDSRHVGWCWVIKMDSGETPYKMWYTGTDDPDGDKDYQIGYATSVDGINWQRFPSGVTESGVTCIANGSGEDWDALGVAAPTVIYTSGATPHYQMWYVGLSENEYAIGYATSADGINWVKYNNPDTNAASGETPYANSDPVIKLGSAGSWDGAEIHIPTVIKEGSNSIYRMWYGATEAAEDSPDRIGYASSLDGINWRKYDGNPVIMKGDWTSDDFDENCVTDPMVLKDGNTYKMWYTGYKDCETDCIKSFGYATSQAYQGTHLEINKMMVTTHNTSGGMQILVACIPEGPSPLDINELKVVGPGGFSYIFSNWDIMNVMGHQFSLHGQSQVVSSGQYTFSVEANNGQTASNNLTLNATTIPVPADGGSNLDRHVNNNTSNEVYAGNATPTFKWKPCVGNSYYYRVFIRDWRHRAIWWRSDLDIGTNTDGDGYMSATPPQGMLKDNTPYHWRVDVYDSNDPWGAVNHSISSWYHFYTGTKDTEAPYDFLDDNNYKAWFRSERSFRDGDRAKFGAFVWNLAPWDIDTTGDNAFLVDDPNNDPFYYFSPGNNAFTLDPFPFMYIGWINGFPADGDYDFYVYENGTAYSESATKTFSGVTDVPYVTRDEMHHENVVSEHDNSYLPYTDPALYWKDKGSSYKHRVMIYDWNYRRLVWSSDYIDGVSAGNDLSVQVPEGVLEEHNPYRWFVDVFDSTTNNQTRSNWLSFMTGESDELGDELAVDFGVNGLYHYDGSNWTKLSNWNPDDNGMENWQHGLAVDFGANGLYNYDGSKWTRPSSWNPEGMEGWANGLAVDFGANGLYNYDGSNWTRLTPWNPDNDGLESWQNGLAVDFSANGLYNYDGSTWTKLTGWNPDGMEGWANGLAVDFGGNGLYNYDGSNWTRLSSWNPQDMVSWSNGLAVDFGGNGLYNYDGSNWTRLTGWNPQGMGGWANGLAVNFGANGLYHYDGSSWTKLSSWASENGQAWGTDIAVDFGSHGLFNYDGSSWTRLTGWNPEGMEDVDLN